MADTTQAPSEHDPTEATLIFHEQADGRKVGRLPGGKVVLIDMVALDRVRDGEAWFVKLRHRDTFAIADPVERVTRATLESSGGALTTPFAAALAKARHVEVRPPVAFPSVPITAPVAPRPEPPPPRVAAAPIDMSRLMKPSERIALFVDGANMDGASRAAGYFIDFRKTREFLLAHAAFYAGFYYIADFTASDPLQQRFMDFLSHAGFIVRRRPVKVMRDQDTGERIIKGNLDTEIVLDMLNTVDNYDVAFLLSGDSDFERAVDLLRSRGKRVYVVSARATLSRELAYVADKPIFYLEDHRSVLARDDKPLAPSN